MRLLEWLLQGTIPIGEGDFVAWIRARRRLVGETAVSAARTEVPA